MKEPLKVIYINHYGVVGGAQRSMLELINAFPQNAVAPHVITPGGRITNFLKQMGIPYTLTPGGVSKFDHSKLGYYRGFRWLILLREILFIFPTVYSFFRARTEITKADVVHVNEITCLLPIYIIKKFFHKPVITHARVVLTTQGGKTRMGLVKRVLLNYTDGIIAIDKTVAASLPVTTNVNIVHNSFTKSNDSIDDNAFAKKLSTLPRRKLNIGFIGTIQHNKGIFDLLKTALLCKRHNVDVNFIIAGNKEVSHSSTRIKMNKDADDEFHKFIADNNLHTYVHPLGFSYDTAAFFNYIDVICFPSYYDAPGRPVFEAAFFSKPSIVALTTNTFDDTFIDGKTGIKVNAGDPVSIYNAIMRFFNNPDVIRRMGDEAYTLACRNFEPSANALKVLNIYQSVSSKN